MSFVLIYSDCELILASQSEYFKTLFTQTFLREPEIELEMPPRSASVVAPTPEVVPAFVVAPASVVVPTPEVSLLLWS